MGDTFLIVRSFYVTSSKIIDGAMFTLLASWQVIFLLLRMERVLSTLAGSAGGEARQTQDFPGHYPFHTLRVFLLNFVLTSTYFKYSVLFIYCLIFIWYFETGSSV